MLLPRTNFNFLSYFSFYLQYAGDIVCCSGGPCIFLFFMHLCSAYFYTRKWRKKEKLARWESLSRQKRTRKNLHDHDLFCRQRMLVFRTGNWSQGDNPSPNSWGSPSVTTWGSQIVHKLQLFPNLINSQKLAN